MKKNEGITIITVIITVLVIIILAAITIYYGLSKNADKAVETKTSYEVYSLLEAVNNRSLMNRLNPTYYELIGNKDFGSIEIGKDDDKKTYYGSDGWYLINSKNQFSELGLDNIEGEYLVNYDTGLAVSTKGVMYENVVYYSLNDLKSQMGGGVTVLSRVEYDEDKKVNKPVLSQGMVPVKLFGNDWIVTNIEDDGWYDYSKGEMAWANVMLMDELEVEGYTNEQVKETPISELVGKKVTEAGSTYVWIPRYTTTSIGTTGSKVIFSNLTNDVFELDGQTYILPDSFEYGDGSDQIQLTGIWVSKYEAGFDK